MDGRNEVSGFWTVERIDTIMRMIREENATMGQAALAIGTTRNAVIGKYHRVCKARGLSLPPRKPCNPNLLTLPGELKRNTVPKRSYTRKQREPKPAEDGVGFLFPVVVVSQPVTSGVGILDVTGCRYPVADDPALIGGVAFCNDEFDGNRMYCALHARIAFNSPPRKSGHMKHRTIPTSLLRAGGF